MNVVADRRVGGWSSGRARSDVLRMEGLGPVVLIVTALADATRGGEEECDKIKNDV